MKREASAKLNRNANEQECASANGGRDRTRTCDLLRVKQAL